MKSLAHLKCNNYEVCPNTVDQCLSNHKNDRYSRCLYSLHQYFPFQLIYTSIRMFWYHVNTSMYDDSKHNQKEEKTCLHVPDLHTDYSIVILFVETL